MKERRLGWVAVVCAVALSLRLWAAATLPMDFDEPITLEAAQAYGVGWAPGGVPLGTVTTNREHPGLVKALYGLGLAVAGPGLSRAEQLGVCRVLSAVLGTGLVAGVAWVHPGMGFLLAIHPLHIKYSAQATLETLPGLLTALAALLWVLGRNDLARWWAWGLVGAAAAGKYPYGVLGLVLVGSVVGKAIRNRKVLREVWVGPAIMVGVFLLANPQCWGDPMGELWRSVGFHPGYAAGLQESGLSRPPWAVLSHLAAPLAWKWHPAQPWLPVEPVALALCLWGLVRGWNLPRVRFFAAWAIFGLALLLAWPTRWPHHVMLVLPALFLGSGYGHRLSASGKE
jgi:hypothetical protein